MGKIFSIDGNFRAKPPSQIGLSPWILHQATLADGNNRFDGGEIWGLKR